MAIGCGAQLIKVLLVIFNIIASVSRCVVSCASFGEAIGLGLV